MKTTLLTTVLIFISGSFALAQPIPPDSLYFGQTPPGNIPQIFAPGIVSKPGLKEATITFSPDGTKVFFHIQFFPQPIPPYIMYANYTNNHWTTPDTIPFSFGRTAAEPFFAYNGTRVYMYATNAVNHFGTADLSYSELQGVNWSDPISMGNPPNSETWQYHPCIVGDTSVYFSSNAGDICRSQYLNGVYQSRIVLPVPVNHIGSQTWGDPYVPANESYMILKSIRPEGFGQNDIYISYKKQDSSWTNPKNLGNIINTPGDETAGDITPDGLYMTFGRNNDLYWVSTSFIDSLKYTNYIPYLKKPVPDQTTIHDELFTFTIPDSTFIDDDGNETLTYHAILTNGEPLPGWLTFDSITATFTGTPSDIETLNIKVTATDTAAASVSDIFKITVTPHTSVYQINGQNDGVRIYPNPTHGMVNICLDSFSSPATVEICNSQGRIIRTNTFKKVTSIDMTPDPKGIYIFKLFIENGIVAKQICIQ